MPTPFLPPLSNLISADAFPAELGTFQDILTTLLDDLHYKNLRFSKSHAGDAGFYSFIIIPTTELGLEIPGTGGLALVLNPGTVSNTEIPISFEYRWEVLKYVKNFRPDSFTGAISDVFNLLLDVSGLSKKALIEQTISILIEDLDPIQKFVDDINTKYSPTNSLVINYSAVDPISDLYQQMTTSPNNLDVVTIILTDHIDTGIDFDSAFERIKKLLKDSLGNFTHEKIKEFLLPNYRASIDVLSIGIRFPVDILRQVNASNVPLHDSFGNDIPGLVTFNIGSLSFDSENGFVFAGENTFTFVRSEILRTGFAVEISGLKLDLSRKKNIPEAIADGRPTDFIGAYITHGSIYLPASWQHDGVNSPGQLSVSNLLVGTGGISGTISMERKPVTPNTQPALIKGTFGQSIEWTINKFNLVLQQNSVVTSDIQGTLTVPGFTNTSSAPVKLDISIHIGTNGDFNVTAKNIITPPTWEIEEVLTISVSSVYVGKKNGRFYLGVSGKINFIYVVPFLGDVLPKGIEVKKLIIWDDGNIEFEGGNLILPNAIGLKIGPAKLAITALSMGSYERAGRKYKYVGFDGGINISPGGVDARANGVKLYFSVDGGALDIFIRIEGIAIDLIIPGNAKPQDAAAVISGFLSMKEPVDGDSTAGTEYAGGISLWLPKPQISGSAAMRLQPNWPAFLIDASLELSTPIPLGTTGLSIYGFRGLLGFRYVASKPKADLDETDPWYQYYKAEISPDFNQGIQASKFAAKPGFSLGAGVSVATGADQGKAFSSKLFLLLSLPEVLLLQGQGAIMRERVGLDTVNDPPFTAMIALSKHSVEAAFGVNYKLPEESGKIASVDGLIEMGFFFGNSSAWYINVGRDLPVEKRIQARILNLFNAYFYLMLSSGGIRAGAGASWAFSKSFGPVDVEAGAYIDLAGKISFKPKQIGGSIQLGGYAKIKIFKFKLGLTISASLAAEAPKPFIVTGSVSVAIDLPKPLKDISVDIDFTWTFDATLNAAQEEVIDAANIAMKPPAKALSMVTNETFGILYHSGSSLPTPDSTWDDYVVPMDSFIDIEFTKGVFPNLTSGSVGNYGGVTSGTSDHIEMIPPQRGKSDQVKHTFEVKDIKIFSYDYTATPDPEWVEYNPFEAYVNLTDPLFLTLTTTELAALKYGFWQKDMPNKYTKLRVLAQHSLSFLSQGTGGVVPEELGITADTIFCEEEAIVETCIDFDSSEVFQNIISVPVAEPVHYRGVLLKMDFDAGIVLLKPDFDLQNALCIPPSNQLEIILPELSVSVCLSLSGNDADLTLEYYKRIDSGLVTSSNLPIFEWDLITSTTITPATLSDTFCYDDIENPVDRVLIINGACASPTLSCGELTAQASQLLVFLNILADSNQLVSTFKIYPDYASTYDNVFEETILYDPVYTYSDILYTVQLLSATQLTVQITDVLGYACVISLELAEYDPAFDMAAVTKIYNLQADPDFENNGANYHFTVTADTSAGSYTLKGTSCYPIEYCLDSCHTALHKICYLSLESAEFNQTIPSQSQVTDENEAMLDSILKITPPVWRPFTDFIIKVETKDTISNIDSPPGPYTRYHSFGFRTHGPIGHFHDSQQAYHDLADADRADQYRLASLKPYIDYATSYPNADGNILNAKPLFYDDPKLLLYYKYAHAYTMLRNWAEYHGIDNGVDIQLSAVIKDPAEPTASPSLIQATFSANKGPQGIDLQTLNNLVVNSDPCSEIEGPVQPEGIHSEIETGQLLPEKLYTALYYVLQKIETSSTWNSVEVHRYPFQTSRYADFTEQIQSYILSNETSNERYAVFNVDMELLSTQLTSIQAVINGTESASDPLLQQFADPFDRIINGILVDFPQLDPPQTTEFNIIRNSDDNNKIVAILVRSTEPFNDPKLPVSELSTTLSLSVNSGSSSGYQKIFSKDRSKILITNSSSDIDVGSAEFTFLFKLYDGYAYGVVSTETATITIA